MLAALSHISFSYHDGDKALDALSLEIGTCELLGLAGHNGAGKTTLLKLLAGLLLPQEGTIAYRFPKEREGAISYVPDQGGFYDELSGIENLRFRGRIAKVPQYQQKTRELICAVGLEKKQNAPARTYSHGMKKRLALACACITQPSLLLLDESLNGIDPESRDHIVGLLKNLVDDGTSVILSTHDLELIEGLCTRLAILQEGTLQYDEPISNVDGDIRQLYREITSRDLYAE